MDAIIDAVRVAGTPEGPVPVVLLAPENGTEATGGTADERDEETQEDDVLPIFIGFDEGISIARGMDAAGIDRPLTHDLTLDLVEELGGRVERVVVSEIVENTYIADLYINTPRGEDTVIDARPSDSLALATRTNAPIEIDDEVFDHGRRPREDFEELDDIRAVLEAPITSMGVDVE